MSKLNRYQNPEIFERLAMSYAAGTLHGRARLRFEALKKQHFYLEATADAYESKFGNLAELLPSVKPPEQVWKNIEAAISTETTTEKSKSSWFSWLSNSYALTLCALLVAMVIVVNPLSTSSDAIAYAAVLEDTNNKPMAITRITHDDLSVSIDIVKDIPLEDGKVLKLWCYPKNGGKPQMMGHVSKTGQTVIKINARQWDHMGSIGRLEISAESRDHSDRKTPQNTVMLKGQLTPISEQ